MGAPHPTVTEPPSTVICIGLCCDIACFTPTHQQLALRTALSSNPSKAAPTLATVTPSVASCVSEQAHSTPAARRLPPRRPVSASCAHALSTGDRDTSSRLESTDRRVRGARYHTRGDSVPSRLSERMEGKQEKYHGVGNKRLG